MGVRTVRLDDEAEQALAHIVDTTGALHGGGAQAGAAGARRN